ncbi:MAG: F0F1 ATP synthase subunit B [Lachnospiraceae bacterium]|nr:F0F1 ATP synthase subunit B [Lachnospiraceae bacterium]
MTRLFDLDFQLLHDAVLMIIAIFALFLIASNLLFDPVRKMMQDRQDRIANDIESAKEDKESALALKLEYEEKLKNIDKEAEQILSEARAKALKNEDQIVAKAKEEAAAIIARANKEAELEKQKVVDDVKKEMVTLASIMAGKVVKASVDATVQDGLIDETLKEMGESTWLS